MDAAVRVALEHIDLPDTYRISIRALVRSRAMNWRSCCGGHCNPCVGRIEEAVDRARALLIDGDLEAISTMGESACQTESPVASTSTDGAQPPSTASSSIPKSDGDNDERNWGLDYR